VSETRGLTAEPQALLPRAQLEQEVRDPLGLVARHRVARIGDDDVAMRREVRAARTRCTLDRPSVERARKRLRTGNGHT